MYVEEIVAKRNGKEYKTLLVRESFRLDGAVQHRTIANISNLPSGCVEQVKRYLQGKSEVLDLSQVQVGRSKEYGASASFLSTLKKIKLDQIISPKKSMWRDLIIAYIVESLIYNAPIHLLCGKYLDSIIWDGIKKPSSTRLDRITAYWLATIKLSKFQSSIQKKILSMNSDKCTILKYSFPCFYIDLFMNEEFDDFHSMRQSIIDWQKGASMEVYTNASGIPFAVEPIFSQAKDLESKKKIEKLVENKMVIHVLDETTEPLNQNINENYIMCIPHLQAMELINRENLNLDLPWASYPVEIKNPDNLHSRYLLCHNPIKTIYNPNPHPSKAVLVNRTYILESNVSRKLMSNGEIAAAYNQGFPIRKFYKALKIFFPEDIYDKELFENLTRGQVFLRMFAHYLRLHIDKKLEKTYMRDPQGLERRWTFRDVVEKLKAIRIQNVVIGNSLSFEIKSTLDEEHEEIISTLGVTLLAKFLKVPL